MRKLIFAGLLLMIGFTSMAQTKYGHINLGNLISQMPAATAADDTLQAYQVELISVGEAMAKDFQEKYIVFATAAQEGTLTPIKQQEQQAALEKQQQDIAAYEQQIGRDMETKRNELLQPIVARAQQAIEDVAKENNIQLVFDTSVFGAIMFAAESEDVMDLVKAKLGL